jgi:DNA-binding MarR family transcriptional regulator
MDFNIDYRLVFALMNGKASAMIKRKLNEDFRKAGLELSSDQGDVLLAISMRDTATQQQLCEATSVSKTTMTRLLDNLEERGIVKRDKSRVDWRSNYVRITRYGETVRDKAKYTAVQTLKDCLRGLSRKDILTAQRSLQRVMDNLDEIYRANETNEAENELRRRREKLLRRLILHKK